MCRAFALKILTPLLKRHRVSSQRDLGEEQMKRDAVSYHLQNAK
jgi:hypothetical protein